NRLKAVIVRLGPMHDSSHRRHVAIFNVAAKRVGQKILGECLNKLIGLCDERTPQVVGTFDRRAVGQYARRIDRRQSLRIDRMELTHRIEILQREPEWIHDAVTAHTTWLRTVLLQSLAYA